MYLSIHIQLVTKMRVDRKTRLEKAHNLILQRKPQTLKDAIILIMIEIGVSERCAREYLKVLEAQGVIKSNLDGSIEYPSGSS